MKRKPTAVRLRRMARLAAGTVAIAVLNAHELWASPIVFEGWDQVDDVSGWINTMPDGAVLSNNSNYLNISFAEVTVPLPNQDDIIRTGPGVGAGFTGDYVAAGIQSINFEFRAQDYAPDSLALYFASASRVWSLALNTPAVAVWSRYSVSLDYTAGWTGGPGADEVAFMSDLATVDWIGVFIGRTYAGCDLPPAQSYGLDSFYAQATGVPEPEDYALLVVALLSLLIVFRSEFRRRWRGLLVFMWRGKGLATAPNGGEGGI